MQRFLHCYVALMILAQLRLCAQETARATVEFPRPDGVVTIQADRIERILKEKWVASGNVQVTYKDLVVTTDRLEYNADTDDTDTPASVRFAEGIHWVTANRMAVNLRTQMGIFYDAEGFTDQDFYFKAKVVRKTGPGTYRIESAIVTACEEDIPKWSFAMGHANMDVKSYVSSRNTLFRIKNIPLFYTPYVRVPLQRKRRASGFLIPNTGTSNNKGRRVSESFYLTLGDSADFTFTGDYFSKRGAGYGGRFRARPRKETDIELRTYFIKDRLRQGGTLVAGNARTELPYGFRGVAEFNLVTNFAFRQVFSDTFRAATTPNETSTIFLTNNFRSFSFNLGFNREETFFPVRNILIREAPVIQLRSVGTPLGSDFHLEFESTLDGMSRIDALLETPPLVQRFDLFPRIYYSGLKTSLFSLIPRLGLRETFYSDSRDPSSNQLAHQSLHRQYVEADVDLLGPVLQRHFDFWGGLRHSLEPELTYRWIHGIDQYRRVLRFDEVDAVADTNEIEYTLTQRFFKRGNYFGDGDTNHEVISVTVGQHYFLDRNFGGAMEAGQINQFYPLNTLTGFLYATEPRRFSPVTAVFRLTPSFRYSFDIRSDYDTQRGGFRNNSVTGFFSLSRWQGGLTYFLTQKLDASSFTSHQAQAIVIYGKQWTGLSVSAILNYDIQRSALLNSITRVNYFWDCCGISLEYLQFNVNLRNESQLRFSFFLKGLGAFGTIQRPESIF
ncbi:MAG TPA: LPS assembly protein LptD [Acidobacteriota bacterium]